MSDNLRAKLIRLAHSKPELRAEILPLVTSAKGKRANFGKAAEPTLGNFFMNFFLEASSLALTYRGYGVRKQNTNGLHEAITYFDTPDGKAYFSLWLGGIKADKGEVGALKVSFQLIPPAIEDEKGLTPGAAIVSSVVINGSTRVEVLAKRIAAELEKAGA